MTRLCLNQSPRIFHFTYMVCISSISIHTYSFCSLFYLNTSYMTDSYIGFTLKMESVTKNIIFGLKMMVKSGLEKFILKSVHAGRWLYLLLSMGFWALLCIEMYTIVRENRFPHGGISKIFLDHFSPSFFNQKWYFWLQIPFWG